MRSRSIRNPLGSDGNAAFRSCKAYLALVKLSYKRLGGWHSLGYNFTAVILIERSQTADSHGCLFESMFLLHKLLDAWRDALVRWKASLLSE
jgi:hypothetical protein